MEVITPVFRATSLGECFASLEKVFTVIRKYFDIVTDPSHHCSTHVHVSPVGGFSLDQLRRVARGVFVFQDDISRLVPKTGGAEAYSVPARLPADLLQRVQNLERGALIEEMMPKGNDRNAETWDRKYVAWNFLSLDRIGTVEYREGIFSKTPNDAFDWAILALSAVEIFLRADMQAFSLHWRHHPVGLRMAMVKLMTQTTALKLLYDAHQRTPNSPSA